jgi:catechol 2,3-dioxygenase-like lactoylglutathione lyase family enzyme
MPLAHITLPVLDVPATVRFFEATMGWKPISRPANIPDQYQSAWLQIAPGQELHLLHLPEPAISHAECEFGRHIAVLHARDDFPALKDRLCSAGARLIAPQRETPFERFFFEMPDGYVFEVIAE